MLVLVANDMRTYISEFPTHIQAGWTLSKKNRPLLKAGRRRRQRAFFEKSSGRGVGLELGDVVWVRIFFAFTSRQFLNSFSLNI